MQFRRMLMIVPATLAMLSALAVSSVSAGIYLNTIDDTADLEGRRIVITGPIGCDAGERLKLRVTVSQRDTGALAEGRARLRCTGEREAGTSQTWEALATTRGAQTFEPGNATVCALAVTYDGGRATDSHQWCVDVTLIE